MSSDDTIISLTVIYWGPCWSTRLSVCQYIKKIAIFLFLFFTILFKIKWTLLLSFFTTVFHYSCIFPPFYCTISCRYNILWFFHCILFSNNRVRYLFTIFFHYFFKTFCYYIFHYLVQFCLLIFSVFFAVFFHFVYSLLYCFTTCFIFCSLLNSLCFAIVFVVFVNFFTAPFHQLFCSFAIFVDYIFYAIFNYSSEASF